MTEQEKLAKRREQIERRAKGVLTQGNQRGHDTLMALAAEAHTIRDVAA